MIKQESCQELEASRFRQKKLIARRLGDELLVYDEQTKTAHCLNKIAGELWMACERERSTVEITELLRPELPHIQEEVSNPKAPNATALAVLLRELKSHPWKLNSAMRGRWRNPIQATVDREGAFDALPRLPYQLLDAASRAWLFLRDFQE